MKTPRSKAYLEHLRQLPCTACGASDSVCAAHVRIGNGGGMGLKPSDFRAVPLCHRCHHEQHQHGERTFWNEVGERLGYGPDVAAAINLGTWLASQDKGREVLLALEAVAVEHGP